MRVFVGSDAPRDRILRNALVDGLGHTEVGAPEEADVALIALDSEDDPFTRIDRLIALGQCPVVAIIEVESAERAQEAVARGVFAVAQAWKPREWHHVLVAARDRFADHNRLRAAVERQAVIERAKGILMERHSLDDRAAFELIRRHARSGNRKVVDVASAVVAGHMLLPASGQ